MKKEEFLKIFHDHYRHFLIALIVIGAVVVVFALISHQVIVQDYLKKAQTIDNSYSKYYEETIKPEAAKKINSIVYKIDQINGTENKLNTIADWETYDFKNIFWESENITCSDSLCRYLTFENGGIRVGRPYLTASPYKGDPYWVAYYKVGACEELAVLFNEVSGRAGFVTRIVTYPNQHAWVEIKRDNGWWYFDPDCYHKYGGSPEYSSYWFNRTSNYRKYCFDFDNVVRVDKTDEDITSTYIRNQDSPINQKTVKLQKLSLK